MNSGVVRLLLIGPGIVLLLTAFLAASALVAGALGRLERLAALGARTMSRLTSGRALLLLWGLSALLLTLLSAAILVNIKVLALLGLALVVLGLILAGFGMGVSAVRCGRRLTSVLGHPQASPLLGLVTGLTAFFLAAFLPFFGWLLVLCAILTGIGATLDTLLRRAVP